MACSPDHLRFGKIFRSYVVPSSCFTDEEPISQKFKGEVLLEKGL
jgi:hypothetical protein